MLRHFSIRKTISLISVITLALVVGFCLYTGKDIPQSIDSIITAFIGFLGYYFGKSTALDVPKKEVDSQ